MKKRRYQLTTIALQVDKASFSANVTILLHDYHDLFFFYNSSRVIPEVADGGTSRDLFLGD